MVNLISQSACQNGKDFKALIGIHTSLYVFATRSVAQRFCEQYIVN